MRGGACARTVKANLRLLARKFTALKMFGDATAAMPNPCYLTDFSANAIDLDAHHVRFFEQKFN